MMKKLSEILAKSKEYGSLSLLEHTIYVVIAVKYFANRFNFDFNLEATVFGAIIHDLGKAHPYFQSMIAKDENDDFDFSEYKHRHEISSLAFLPAIPKEYWDIVIDMVVAHHKSILNDSRERGILDIKTNNRYIKENHLEEWFNWKNYGLEIFKQFEINTTDITYEDAYTAIDYAINYCSKKTQNVSYYRGLLKAADHFASAFGDRTEKMVKNTFIIPNLDKYFEKKRISDLYPLSKIPINDKRMHTIVVAPTGAGKTDFLMKRTTGRVFYTLPFQASINSMWQRFKEMDKENPDIRLLHSTSKVIIGKNDDEKILQPLIGSSIKVLTPHQLAAIIFGTTGYESIMLDLKGCDVILDEIHTYSDISKSMVLEIVKTLLRLDCRIHIGTATMPILLYNFLLEILGGSDNVFEVNLDDSILETFNRHQIEKSTNETYFSEIIANSVKQNEKLLIVVNTIDKSQEIFKQLELQYPDVEKMLIHSRFRRKDRANLEYLLKYEFDGNNEKSGKNPCIVVSTQVVEVSLDISFDRMITQAAPIDSLIQRFGRVNRRRNETSLYKNTRKYKPIHVFFNEKDFKPYTKDIVSKSFEVLPDNFEVLEEKYLQKMIDEVYNQLDIKSIDIHLIHRNGNYVIKELTDNKKAILSDLLDIESCICILESDKENYANASYEDKIQFEIPISFKKIKYSKINYEQLKIGSYPFVIPQNEEEHKKYGLELKETSNII